MTMTPGILPLVFAGLFCGMLAAQGQPAGELTAGKNAGCAADRTEGAQKRAARLESLARDNGPSQEIVAEAKLLLQDLKKARGAVNWAAVEREQGARVAARRLAEAAAEVESKVEKLLSIAPAEARAVLQKVVRTARKTRSECEKRIAEIDVGGSPDPFAEYALPRVAPVPENPSRDAQIEAAGKR
ncbi:MAG: hypothetical protein HY927_07325 [Elusimicrobia bacterium]|nr:hypothetical protein [Elusimicrobiota bacterium]